MGRPGAWTGGFCPRPGDTALGHRVTVGSRHWPEGRGGRGRAQPGSGQLLQALRSGLGVCLLRTSVWTELSHC